MIELRNVSMQYGDLAVLENICLTIAKGEIVSIVGSSGTGKTTLLRIVAGLLNPTQGSSLIDGVSSRQAIRSGRLGYVLQNPTLLPWRNVLENVALPLELRKAASPQRVAKAHEALGRVGLGAFAKSQISELSGGMKQRVSIARALVSNPDILIMDEPFGALDEQLREQSDLDLRNLTRQLGQTVMFVTHSLFEAVLLSDRVVMLGGRPARVKGLTEVDLPDLRDEHIGSERHTAIVRLLRKGLKESK